jgi:hypothetical protein
MILITQGDLPLEIRKQDKAGSQGGAISSTMIRDCSPKGVNSYPFRRIYFLYKTRVPTFRR